MDLLFLKYTLFVIEFDSVLESNNKIHIRYIYIYTRERWKVLGLAYNWREARNKRPMGRAPDRGRCHCHTMINFVDRSPWLHRREWQPRARWKVKCIYFWTTLWYKFLIAAHGSTDVSGSREKGEKLSVIVFGKYNPETNIWAQEGWEWGLEKATQWWNS